MIKQKKQERALYLQLYQPLKKKKADQSPSGGDNCALLACTLRGKIVNQDFFIGAHYVFNLNFLKSEEFSVSFLLANDHGLEPTTKLVVIGADDKKILYFTNLTSHYMQQKEVTNPSTRRFLPSDPTNSSYDVRCSESEGEYKLRLGGRRLKILQFQK